MFYQEVYRRRSSDKNNPYLPQPKNVDYSDVRSALSARTSAFKSGNTDDRKQASYDLRRSIKVAKRQYKNKVEEHFNNNNPRSMWQGINNITGFKGNKPATVNIAASLPDELNTFYARFEADNTAHTESAAAAAAEEVSPLTLSVADVTRSFKRVNIRKAVGPDGIPGRVLKACAFQLAGVFTDIFNLSLSLSVVPSCFKKSTIVPIPKKNLITCLNDWRPVALTPIFSKCFEKLVREHICSVLPASLDPLQFAYRSNRSTDDAIAFTLHTALSHLENKNTYVRMLFVDYSLAFNTIVPATLVAKLQTLGLNRFRFRRCIVQSTLGMAPLNLCFNILFYVFLLSLFTRITSALFIYDRRTLLDIGHHCTNLLQDTLSTDPAWPLEILRTAEVNKGRLNNPRRRRKHRGRRAGIRNRLRKRAHSPPLPSILLANVQSLENKMDDLRARISFQRDIRDCNILCLTETWLTPSVPDNAVTPSDNFSVLRMDRTAEAGKTKGGGVCFMINKKWCDPRNISILSRSCSAHLEHLSIICRPFYLPREFTSIIITAVYIPPQADTSVALSTLHDELSGYINKHPDAASIIAGDFNKANLKKVMPNFHQHISCPTRGQNTLDHCYTQFKNAYKARSLPAFGKSDHAAIFLTPEYKQRIVQRPPVEREVTRWSAHSEAMLQASLDDVDWDMFRASSTDVSEFTDVAVSFINTLTEQATETVTIRTFSNQKPWVDRSIRDAVNHRTAAYNAGLLSGNMSEYKTACYALRRAIRAAKRVQGEN